MIESTHTTATRSEGQPLRASRGGGTPQTPEQKKLYEAARDFESVMLGMVFKQMSQGQGDGLLGGGSAQKTWREMLNDERAKSMTAAGGIGLADAIYRQLATRL
ncbi:MAG: rod-binding protein [Candidatus Sericytochromatia bacterium]|nr:rod-binding protein [Candidatus Sericytochromatia bacterium]